MGLPEQPFCHPPDVSITAIVTGHGELDKTNATTLFVFAAVLTARFAAAFEEHVVAGLGVVAGVLVDGGARDGEASKDGEDGEDGEGGFYFDV